MKKFKLMLVALLALFGVSSVVYAAIQKDDVITYGNYKYTITKMPTTLNPVGTVTLMAIADEVLDEDLLEGDGVLNIPGHFSYTEGNKTYEFDVTQLATNEDGECKIWDERTYYCKKIIIPKQLTEIPTATFSKFTNVTEIEFAEDAQVKRIGAQAFASTKITSFDFSNCKELEGLNDEVFVERWNGEEGEPNQNVNSYIETVTLPISPNFLHIAGAFRNLTELTTIENLEDSWIQEIVGSAFANTAITSLELPGKNLQYIDKDALVDSKIENLTINYDKLLMLGGCHITYEEDDDPESDNFGSYVYTYADAEADANLYGFDLDDEEIAPLATLTLQRQDQQATLQGKICKNAFLNCDGMEEGVDLSGVYYGSKAQIQTSAFESCDGITSLQIRDIAYNETGGFTIQDEAFKGCPITEVIIGNINTASAIGVAAFGTELVNVTIGTVKADATAIAAGAFVWGENVDEATLSLAAAQGEVLELNQGAAEDAYLIAAGAFDFSAIETAETKYPVVTIGEIKSKGGVFAAGALVGPTITEIDFVGNINTDGLNVCILSTVVRESMEEDWVREAELGEKYEQGWEPFMVGEGTEEHQETMEVTPEEGDPYTVFHIKKITETEDHGALATLTFSGEIKTDGIGDGAFTELPELTSVTFSGLLNENAVKAGSFTESGKANTAEMLEDDDSAILGQIGSEKNPFVNYACENIPNYTLNPFEQGAFGSARDSRVIWWEVANDELEKRILGAIQKAVLDEQGKEYAGTVYNTKFNIYKWVAKLDGDDEIGLYFLLFQDLSENGNNKIAWGRYDLGMFEKENNKYYKENSTDPAEQLYEATDMVIPRYQTTDGVKVKLTLYGMYYDEDDFGGVSSTYLVPLRVVDGTYQISEENEHVIIAKAEIQGNGSFKDKDVKIFYNNVPGDVDGSYTAAWGNDDLEVEYEEENDAVWTQLQDEDRVYEKATKSWMHQELWDAVTRYDDGSQAPDISVRDLWIMTDPSKYVGFRIDRNKVTKDDNTFIGINWYFALLKNYNDEEAAARVIWLDDAQATAIFGVKEGKASVNSVKNSAIYNMQGIRVSKPGKGLYIQDGKKFIVK